MHSAKTTENGSIQITSAEAGQLKVVLPYHPDRIAKIKGRGLLRNCRRPRMDEMQRRTSKKSLGLRSQILAGCHRGLILHRKAIGILYGTR
jgi:hypothetical protein